MSRLDPKRATLIAVAALVVAGLSGCGDTGDAKPSSAATSPSPADETAGRTDGDWLLRFTTARGADGEKVGSVYVRYNPSTGAATARALPTVTTTDAGQGEEMLLVSADHQWAIQDTGVPRAETASGRLTLYSVTGDTTRTLDIRTATGKPGLRAVGWAFDPEVANVLRVVDSDHVVWKVDLATSKATQEGTLQLREGWIFANGFDKNTGEPYVESIDSDQTDPPGNGDSDASQVDRQGGTQLRYDGSSLGDLPKPPCEFAGGFRFDDSDAWLFCADSPNVSAYRLGNTSGWFRVGKPSPDVVPGAAVELSFALPPVD